MGADPALLALEAGLKHLFAEYSNPTWKQEMRRELALTHVWTNGSYSLCNVRQYLLGSGVPQQRWRSLMMLLDLNDSPFKVSA